MYNPFRKNKGSTGSSGSSGSVSTAVCTLTRAIDESTQCCSADASTITELLEQQSHLSDAHDYLREQKNTTDCDNEYEAYAMLQATKMSEITQSRQEVAEARLLQKYSEISLDFLSKRRPLSIKEKNAKLLLPFVPVFSCHQRSRDTAYAGKLVFNKAKFGIGYREDKHIKEGMIHVAAYGTSKDILDKACVTAFSKVLVVAERNSSIYKHPKASPMSYINTAKCIHIEHEFLGIIPEDTRKKIDNAVNEKDFDDIYLIKECTEWNVSPITQDPLIIGIKGEKAYIIDHFDCTDIESYVKKEFGV